MKKWLLCGIMFLFIGFLYGQSKSFFSVEGGWYPGTPSMKTYGNIDGDRIDIRPILLYSQFNAQLRILRYGYLGGGVQTLFSPDKDDIYFYPFIAQYEFDAGIVINHVIIGYQHICEHAVNPMQEDAFSFDKGFDKVFLKYYLEF